MNQAATAPTSFFRRFQRALRRNSPADFARLCAANLAALFTGRWKDQAYVYDPSFDREHGVDTAGIVEVDELAADRAARASAQRYEATPPECFRFLIGETGIQRPADYSFVDLGSGKGRVLLLAALAGFKSVAGVELCANLHRIARENIRRAKGLPVRPQAMLGDATSFSYPLGPAVCFLNNPFGPDVLQSTLDNIEQSLRASPRDFRLIYYHCNHQALIDARKGWRSLSRGHWQSSSHHYAVYVWDGSEAKLATGS